MIAQDTLQLGRGHRLEGSTEGLESGILGHKDGEVSVCVYIFGKRAVGSQSMCFAVSASVLPDSELEGEESMLVK